MSYLLDTNIVSEPRKRPGLTVLTRDSSDFARLDVQTLNPWT